MRGKGLAVLRCLDLERSVLILRDYVRQVEIVRSGSRIRESVPAVYDIACIQCFAVRPFQTVTQREGIGQRILAHFVTLCQLRHQLSLFIISVQSGERENRKTSAVYGRVQRRVKLIRF